MAGTYTITGTISNLTRVELEQLRRADFFTNGKALTVGDSALSPEGVVGRGDLLAEPYSTTESLRLEDVYSGDIPTNPGNGLGPVSSIGAMVSETVRWYGPDYIYDATTGYAFAVSTWRDDSPGLNYTLFVNVGDILLIKQASGDANSYTTATISARTANTLTLTNIQNPSLPGTTLDAGSTQFPYIIVRPNAVRLFAVPGSGPVGQEQTFMTVNPSSTLHSDLSPSFGNIEADRLRNLVPPQYSTLSTSGVDRADAVYNSPRLSLDNLGYRIVLYQSNGTGLAPDLTKPIAALNPKIDSTLPVDDQRMTWDYKAGILRFSCAPRLGDDIKVAGGVDPTTGRLSLFAVFWTVDTTFTAEASRHVYAQRNSNNTARVRGRIYYHSSDDVWKIGQTTEGNELYVEARPSAEVPGKVTRFGIFDNVNPGPDPRRYFAYRTDPTIEALLVTGSSGWVMREHAPHGDDLDIPWHNEVRIAEKTSWSFGDGSNPPQGWASDINPIGGVYGYRDSVTSSLQAALLQVGSFGYGSFHLRKGRYYTNGPVVIPPGVMVEGEGSGTSLETTSTTGEIFKFGPNTFHGVFDFGTTDGVTYYPTEFTWLGSLEGFDICWNPTRRVWAVVQADATTGSIWFNEVTPIGSAVWPGAGIDLKQNANPLFTNASPNSKHHTPAHYPRIAHHWKTDEYAVVWVEEYNPGGGVGPRVALKGFKVNKRVSPSAVVDVFATDYPTFGNAYKTHPCIAVNNADSAATHKIHLGYWSYDSPTTLATSHFSVILANANNPVITTTNSTSLGALRVISSSDVDDDGFGKFCAAFSVRRHPILYRTGGTGSTTAGSEILTDLGGWASAGVDTGSRFVYLEHGTLDSGRSGTIYDVLATTLKVHFDDAHNDEFRATLGSVDYAVTPRSWIHSLYYDGFTWSVDAVAGSPSPGFGSYHITEREPDFVRISFGGGQWCVAYQAFHTNAILNGEVIRNFDGGVSAAFKDAAHGICRSDTVHRQHISTCFAIISEHGEVSAPSVPTSLTDPTGTILTAANATGLTKRALGGRVLNIPYPNLMNTFSPATALHFTELPGNINESNLEMEISARNYTHAWTDLKSPSLIPAITWSGSDWVIASPSVNKIQSDTGTYLESAGIPYLADPTFYFGLGVPSPVDGSFLHKTISIGDQIYFPTLSQTRTIVSVSSEHVVELNATLATANPTSKLQWVLKRVGSHYGMPAGLKNPGFRVNSNGEAIVQTNYFTFATSPLDSDPYTPRTTELLLGRGLWGLAAFTGDIADGTINKFGAAFISWNDYIGTARVSGDVTYRGVGVGIPKGCSEQFLDEAPMIALAWGDNFYGFMDRNLSNGVNLTSLSRQSFGPWKSGIKDMALSSPYATILPNTTVEHVFTRHGYSTSGNPYFATDGYRNFFSYVGASTYLANYPYGFNTYIGDAREESAWFKNLMGVYTDAVGRDSIIHRGPPLVGYPHEVNSPRELIDTLGSQAGAANIVGTGIVNTGTAAPKVIWNGKRFVTFHSTLLRQQTPLDTTATSQLGGQWPKTRGLVQMTVWPGDEGLDYMNETLIGNMATFVGSLTATAGTNSPQVVASSPITCGLHLDWDVQDMVVLDVAYSGNVYCVVWTMGYNVSASPGRPHTGGSAVGYTLFPDLEGAYDGLFTTYGTGVPSFTIDTISSVQGVWPLFSFDDLSSYKGRYLNPKVIWDGKHFMITYQVLNDSLGVSDGGKTVAALTVDELGPGNRSTHIKALSANQTWDGATIQDGLRRSPGFVGGLVNRTVTLGQIAAVSTLEQGGIVVRGNITQPEPHYNNYQIMPGDILEITGLTPTSGAASNSETKYNGFYPVTDTIPNYANSSLTLVDIGVRFENAVHGWNVHGIIHSGGLGTTPYDSSDGALTSGVNTKAHLLISQLAPFTVNPSGGSLNDRITRLHGVVHNERRDEYIILAECYAPTTNAPHTGSSASITAGPDAEGNMTMTGLSGMTAASVNRPMTVSAASSATNNGTFLIVEFISAASVKIRNPLGVSPDALNGTIDWSWTDAGLPRLRVFRVKKATMAIVEERDIAAGGTFFPASICYGGGRYLVLYGADFSLVDQNINGAILSEDLIPINSTFTFASYNLFIGNAGTTRNMPGPGYGSINTTYRYVPRLDSMHVVWNDKLNRWLASFSYVSHDQNGLVHNDNYQDKPLGIRDGTDITSWTGRTFTFTSPVVLRQPGQRILRYYDNDINGGTPTNPYANLYWTRNNATQPSGLDVFPAGMVVDTTFDFLDTEHVGPGDYVIFGDAGLVKNPRKVIGVTTNILALESDVDDPRGTTSLSPHDLLDYTTVDYEIRQAGRVDVVVSTGAGPVTYTTSSLTDPAALFVIAGVLPGMEILIAADPGTSTQQQLTGSVRVHVDTVTATTLEFSPALPAAPAAATPYKVVKRNAVFTNILTSGSTTTHGVDIHRNEYGNFFSLTEDLGFHMIREDVFLVSVGYTPSVKVEDADSVYIENVDFGGVTDLTERYYSMARPVKVQGGPALGSPGTMEVNSRGPTGHTMLTPVGKVNTVTLTGVRSSTKFRYGRFSR